MLRFKKTAALIIALFMCFSVVSLCGCKKDRGVLLATVGTEEFYSGDTEITDYQNYYYYVKGVDPSSEEDTEEFVDAFNTAVSTVVLSHVYEKELESRGITLDEDEIRASADVKKALFDTAYEGGFKKFCKDIGVSSDVLYKAQYYETLSAKLIEAVSEDITVSENDIENYYLLNREDYAIQAGINYDVILVEVLDLQDESEMSAKKSEAEALLSRLLAGEDFKTVQKEITDKYSGDDYFYTGLVCGESCLAYGSLDKVTDVDATIRDVVAQYEALGVTWDAKADKSSAAYTNYLNYLSSLYRIHLSYALFTATGSGEVYNQIVPTSVGYVLLKNVSERTEDGYEELSAVSEEIESIIREQKVSNAVSTLTDTLCEKYEVVFSKISVSV